MKRNLFLFASLFLFSQLSQAQLRVGIVGGGHQSTIQEENNLPDWETTKGLYKGRTGIHLGFMADLQFNEKSRFYFQPGIIFFNKGRQFSESFDTSFQEKISTQSKQFVNYFDIPLNIVYKLPIGKTTKFVIGAGPHVSFFFSGKENSQTYYLDNVYESTENNDPAVGKGPGQYRTLNYGLNALAGFEFGRVFLTANYSQDLSDAYEPKDYTATKYRNRVIGATLGVFLGKPIMPQPQDADGDGVLDKHDKCPDVAGSIALHGCPDTDGDGVTDAEDNCPGEAGPAENKGCPYRDTDGDSVLDKDDQCVDVKGPVENKGCPWPDTDKDGVADRIDKCPTVAGVARYDGCPVPDTDGDGVNDDEDRCINEKGTAANNGCPEIKKEVKDKVSYAANKIQFTVAKAVLTTGSKKVLDDVAKLLKENPSIQVTIDGHTSDEGTREHNMKLSQERADAVKNYLISKGVDESRLTSIGNGPDKPLNPAKSPAARAQNRRVEMTLSNP